MLQMQHKKRVLVDLSKLYNKYNAKLPPVEADTFKLKVKTIIDDHINKSTKKLKPIDSGDKKGSPEP